MAATEEVKQAIFNQMSEQFLKEQEVFLKTHHREMSMAEKQIAITRVSREAYLTLSNEKLNLIIKGDSIPIQISELFKAHKDLNIDFNITIDLEKSPAFFALIQYNESCNHYILNSVADIYLSDFIDFLLSNYPVN